MELLHNFFDIVFISSKGLISEENENKFYL